MRGPDVRLLRRKLDLLGYTEALEDGNAELVGRLVEDLIRLTESYTAARAELDHSKQDAKTLAHKVAKHTFCLRLCK